MSESGIDMEGAIEIVRSYFSKMRGEEELISSLRLPHSNWIGFDVIETTEKEGLYVIKCEVRENIFSPQKLKYMVKVDARGKLKEVRRVNG